MQLKFKAKGDMSVTEPGAPRVVGPVARYVNRKCVAPVTKKNPKGVVVVTSFSIVVGAI